MQKIAQNLILRSVDEHLILCLQSKGDYDYREFLQIENDGKIRCCIDTDKFLTIEPEGILEIKQEQTLVTIVTEEGEYKFPVMRERGIFMVQPEVILPETPPIKSWEYDFSSKSISTKVVSNVSASAALVIIGENLVARSVNHILEKYGDSSTATLSITPPEYALVQKLGKTKVSVYEKEVSFIGEEGTEVRIRAYKPPLPISSVETNLLSGNKLATFDISKLKLKSVSKFTLDMVYLVFKTGGFSFVTETARKTIEIPELFLNNPITLEIMSSDLKYLTGEITIAETELKGKNLYVVMSKDKEKITYILLRQSYKNMTW